MSNDNNNAVWIPTNTALDDYQPHGSTGGGKSSIANIHKVAGIDTDHVDRES